MSPTERLPADTHGQRLSRYHRKPTPGRMERFLRRLGVSGRAYQRWVGCQTYGEFIKANPSWTQRAFEVLVLENLALLRDNEAEIVAEKASTSLRGARKSAEG